MVLSKIILGLVLLVFGRRLFWLFVAIAGFLVGTEFAAVILAHQPQWIMFLVAVGAGLLGALLAVIAQRVAFGIAGFYAGSYLALMVARSFATPNSSMVIFIVGGVIGAVLAVLIMDWAIIGLSCLVGAGAIVRALALGPGTGAIVFLVLVIFGAFVQTRLVPHPKKT